MPVFLHMGVYLPNTSLFVNMLYVTFYTDYCHYKISVLFVIILCNFRVLSAIRAHLSQRKFLQDGNDMLQSETASEQEDDSKDEALSVIQAAVRGHLTRQTLRDTLSRLVK